MKNARLMSLVSAAFLVGSFPTDSAAQSVRMVDDTTLKIEGPITEETGETFRAIVSDNNVRTVDLSSLGGLVYVALEIAELIHEAGINTWVRPNSECYSACSLIFLAGERRLADGRLGVHQISFDRDDNVLTQSIVADIFAALSRFGAPDDLVAVMLRTPPDQMYVFSPDEVESLGITRREQATNPPHLQVISSTLYGDWLVGTFLNTRTGQPFFAMESRSLDPVLRIVHYPERGNTFGEILWREDKFTLGQTDISFIFERDPTESGPGGASEIRVRSDIEPRGYAWDFSGGEASILFMNRFIYGHRLNVENFAGETIARYGLSGSYKAVNTFIALIEQ
jgi:hypothetical protein